MAANEEQSKKQSGASLTSPPEPLIFSVKALPRIKKLCATVMPPFIAHVGRDGKVALVMQAGSTGPGNAGTSPEPGAQSAAAERK